MTKKKAIYKDIPEWGNLVNTKEVPRDFLPIKIKYVRPGTMKPATPFTTLEDEANFWDTHDVTEDINDGTLIGFHKGNKK